jgi:hypothetical protein
LGVRTWCGCPVGVLAGGLIRLLLLRFVAHCVLDGLKCEERGNGFEMRVCWNEM